MDIRKNIKITRDMLDGNLNRMCVTNDPEELASMYFYARQRVKDLFIMNTARIEGTSKLKEVFQHD